MKKAARGARAGRAAKPEWERGLYVAGQTAKSAAALANLRRLCETHLAGPTLGRKFPGPIRKISGARSNEERVRVGLDVKPFP